MLELTHTVEARKMKEQVLDSMELERERGITIKMQPVRMKYIPPLSQSLESPPSKGEDSPFEGSTRRGRDVFILNLIDTPGHIDFSYEVSRALKAVEGSLLLVDATQGVQAQTLTTLNMARELGLTIIPVISKIDSPLARVAEVKAEVAQVLGVPETEILECSGKTGQGVPELLEEMVSTCRESSCPSTPLTKEEGRCSRSRFRFQYSNHRGVIVYIRVIDGSISKNDLLKFAIADKNFTALEVGTFSPEETPAESLKLAKLVIL
jgi:GTP-binding protein LepA